MTSYFACSSRLPESRMFNGYHSSFPESFLRRIRVVFLLQAFYVKLIPVTNSGMPGDITILKLRQGHCFYRDSQTLNFVNSGLTREMIPSFLDTLAAT